MSKMKKVIISLILLIVAIPVSVAGYVYFKLNSMHTPDDKIKSETNTVKDDKGLQDDIVNILLVGVDGNNLEKGNRSDSMMILTIDNKNKNLKLTSLARDTYVDIKGHSTEKLTHAYAYGGADLLLDTIKSNFNLDIDKYVTVNFKSFINIVDIIDGVEVEVNQNNVKLLNQYIDGCYEQDKSSDKGPKEYITTAGKHTLNGYQALAFSRIRYQDSAFARDGRQREVVQAALDKVMSEKSIAKYIKVMDKAMENTKTNMTPGELISLGTKVLKVDTSNMKNMEFPVYKGAANYKGKGYVVTWDKEKNLNALNDFIFNNKEVKVEE